MSPLRRKKQLLRAGVTCVVQNSIGGTIHADLADACEVSVSTVFSYFPNRGTLIHDILQEVGNGVLENVIAQARKLPEEQQLEATAPLFAAFAEREPDYVKAWLAWSMDFTPQIQRHYALVEERIIDALVPMIRLTSARQETGEDLRDRARVINASSVFLAKMVFDGVSQKRRDAFVEHLLESLLRT